MKTSKGVLLFILIGIFIASGVSAQNSGYSSTMQKSVDNWLSSSTFTEDYEDVQSISAPTSDPKVTPVGDSLFTVVLLSGLYLLWNRKRNKNVV
ncbi:MAG: hypothetical protein LBM08_15005 [Dysgonamonadaceae bacterium]|jgi:hypothetical protein|nr:hypothetical protein [Dysgonamonadaceae bacterium]